MGYHASIGSSVTLKNFLIAEELLLIALDDSKGKIIFSASTALPYGLTGAILLELSNLNKISLDDTHVKIIDASPVNIPVLDNCLSAIEEKSKPNKISYWITKLTSKKYDIHNLLLQGLIEKGVLEKLDHKILYLIPSKRYPMIDGHHENNIRERIKNIVLNNGPCDSHFTSLISLIHACELVNEIFEKPDRKFAKQQVKKIAKNESVGDSVTNKVNEIIMAAIMVNIITTTTVTTST